MDSDAAPPVRPRLCAFPVAFYAGTLLAFGAYWVSGDLVWFHVGVVANVAGIGAAVLAAAPSIVDWGFDVPRGSSPPTTGTFYALQVGAALVFALDAVLARGRWNVGAPDGSVLLAALGTTLAMTGMAAGDGAARGVPVRGGGAAAATHLTP